MQKQVNKVRNELDKLLKGLDDTFIKTQVQSYVRKYGYTEALLMLDNMRGHAEKEHYVYLDEVHESIKEK
jgi:hypothetical protein